MNLGVADEALLFRVLADCSDSQEPFTERLLEVLERHLGLRHSVCFSGWTARDALVGRSAAARGRARAMCEPYFERYAEHDIFRTPPAERRFDRRGHAGLWEFSADEISESRYYIDEFLGRFGMPWVFGIKIEAAPHLPVYLSILSFDGLVPEADMARLALLRRPLGSQLAAGARLPEASMSSMLTAREKQIAALIERGYSNDRIAGALGIRIDTVKKHLTSIYAVHGVTSRTQLAIALHSQSR